MKLNVDRQILKNFEIASEIEWSEMNHNGCYSGSTVYGMNLRPYHGLFGLMDERSDERTLILSKIEESVFIKNHVYELSTNNFKAGIHPKGFQYLSEFALDPFPRSVFKLGYQRLVKTLFLIHDTNVLVIRYALKNQGPELKLILKPLIAGRKTTEMAHEVPNMNTDSYMGENVVKLEPKPGIPELSIFYQKGEYVQAPLWYYNFKYQTARKYEDEDPDLLTEDLFNPGFFSCILKPYETLDLYITTDRKVPTMDYEALYQKERQIRSSYRSKFSSMPAHVPFLMNQVKSNQLHLDKALPYQFQKYHSFRYSTRDFIWSLPGIILIERNPANLMRFIDACIKNIKNGLFEREYPFGSNSITINPPQADLSLLFVNIAYHYYILKKDDTYLEKILFDPCRAIVESFRKDAGFGISMDKDGLIRTGNEQNNVSGVFAEAGRARYGKLVEMQALWYNALKILEFFARELSKNRLAKKYAATAEQVELSYKEKFYDNRTSRYYDVIRDNYKDRTFRYHQIFQLALPFPLLQGDAALLLLNMIENEMLTPFGLRSMSRTNPGYIGTTDKTIGPEDDAYYSGSIWPWTIGIYVDAVLNVRGNHQQVLAYLAKQLENFRQIICSGTLGYISETYDGDEPHARNGAQIVPAILYEYLRACISLDYNKY